MHKSHVLIILQVQELGKKQDILCVLFNLSSFFLFVPSVLFCSVLFSCLSFVGLVEEKLRWVELTYKRQKLLWQEAIEKVLKNKLKNCNIIYQVLQNSKEALAKMRS